MKPKVAETARQERARGGEGTPCSSGESKANTEQSKYGATPAKGSEMPQKN